MNSLNIDIIYNGINIQTKINEGLTILYGYSGTGKSLLMQAIDLYCLNNNISCRLCNYNDMNLSKEKIKSICSDVDVVLLDNADLYVNEDILQSISKTAKFIIISIKDTTEISTADAYMCDVSYNNLSLGIKEL